MASVSDATPERNGNYLTPAEYQILKESFERRLIADTKLSHSFLRVGIVIKWYMNQHSGDAWPGVQTIMKQARVSERTVNRAIKYFEQMSHMDVERRPGGVNHYFPRPILEAESTDTAMTGVNETTTDKAMTGGTDKAMTGGTDKAMTPEPSTEPSIEPSPYGRDEDITAYEGHEGNKEGKESAEVEREVEKEGESLDLSPDPFLSSKPQTVPPHPRPTLEELRVRLNMPELGKSVRRTFAA
jgi:hypothetical protein